MVAAIAGTRLGRYEIRSLLGKGGMGEVHLAQDTQLDRAVALKILPAHLASDPERMRRFFQEARAASALNHPNIITIHEVGHEDSMNFIATEFIDGVTLRYLMTETRMTLREIFDIVIQVVSALAAAHAVGIVHRDIKPENIMLRRDGFVKVLDFGLAKLTEPLKTGSDPYGSTVHIVNTDPGVVMGTVSYMSPEQARGLPVDARTDIWSFGVVLYEMLAGRVPFRGATSSDVIVSILEREPSPLARRAREVPAELERIVSKTLAKDKEERYQTIKDLLIDLRRLKQRLEVEAELERVLKSDSNEGAAAAKSGEQSSANASQETPAKETEKIDEPRTTSSIEYVISEIKNHKRGAAALALLIIVAAGIALYFSMGSKTAIDSIAILPFTTEGVDPVMEKLGDGITVNITNNLRSPQLPRLQVVSLDTMFHYKGQSVEAQKVGTDLGVRAVLIGKVLKQGDTLIVRTELVDVLNRSQLWGEEYTHDQSDIIGGISSLTLQKEISNQILEKLRVKLLEGTKTR
jgi:serine/threonine protein kinase